MIRSKPGEPDENRPVSARVDRGAVGTGSAIRTDWNLRERDVHGLSPEFGTKTIAARPCCADAERVQGEIINILVNG